MNTTTGRNCVLIGRKSEIGEELTTRLNADGWDVHMWARGDPIPIVPWNLCIIAIGRVAPVGLWHEQDEEAWEEAIESNVLMPIRFLRWIWPNHRLGASVCFMAGANPNRYMAGYSAYATGKMALLKACEYLDAETPDAKFFALGPGTVLTKIHDATRKANWPNPVLAAVDKVGEDRQAKIERIYGCLKWAMAQRKEDIGGRNICASDPWDKPWFIEQIRHRDALLKLRRIEA